VKRRVWIENGRNAPGEEQGGELAKGVGGEGYGFGFALVVGAMELVGASSIFETRGWYQGCGSERRAKCEDKGQNHGACVTGCG
jgi:hypothetical protein